MGATQSAGKSEALREGALADQRGYVPYYVKVAEDENIQVEDAEVEQELERMAASAGPQAEQMKRLFDSPGGRQAISGSLLTRKTWERLVSIFSG
jgi:FKBP-type peptidyl-prolyl cis-trans isomerase (trigger factor)